MVIIIMHNYCKDLKPTIILVHCNFTKCMVMIDLAAIASKKKVQRSQRS